MDKGIICKLSDDMLVVEERDKDTCELLFKKYEDVTLREKKRNIINAEIEKHTEGDFSYETRSIELDGKHLLIGSISLKKRIDAEYESNSSLHTL